MPAYTPHPSPLCLLRLSSAQDSQQLYLVMDFHPGGDLMMLLDRFDGVLDEKTARFYLAEIALALHDLHNMGYVHRSVVHGMGSVYRSVTDL